MRHTKPRPPTRSAAYVRLSALATWLLASAALAQPEGLPKFELERLELNPNGRGSLVMGTGELLPAGTFRLSLLGHYERKPLVLYADGNAVGSVVSDRVMAHLLAAWAPLKWLEVDLQVPLVVWQHGDDLRSEGIAAPASTGLSTPSVQARVGLLSQRRNAPVDLAVELGLGLPIGGVDTLSRDRSVRFSPKVMVGRRFGRVRAGLEAGALVRPTTTLIEDQNVQDEVGSEVRLGAVLATTGSGPRGELNVRGTLPLTHQPKSLELLLGLRLPLGRSLEAYALGGPGFGDTPGTPSFRVLLGVSFGGAEPPEVVKDTDADGVPDERDACPTEPGLPELRGCPVKDSDNDSVPDHLDNCPSEKGVPSNQGCPPQQEQLVSIQKGKLEIKESVGFESGKATIQSRSFTMLDQIARVIQQHPEIELVIIEGHTDNVGNAEGNRRLSLARAESVRDYLLSRGVEGSRLAAKGYGPDRPIAPNDTPEGRAANRRVAFTIVTPAEGEQ